MLNQRTIFAIFIVGTFLPTNLQCQVLARRDRTGEDLHGRALAQGNFHSATKLPEPWVVSSDLKSLTTDSSVVVVVDILSNVCELASNGSAIYTKYQAKVAEVLSDDFDSGLGNARDKVDQSKAGRTKVTANAVIPISLAGGKVRFQDGTTAQIDVVNVPRLTNGHRYLLYLHYSPGLRSFVPSQLSHSMFEVNRDGLTLRWMALNESSKGFELQTGTFGETLQDARIHGSQKTPQPAGTN